MWSKLTSAVKSRSGVASSDSDADQPHLPAQRQPKGAAVVNTLNALQSRASLELLNERARQGAMSPTLSQATLSSASTSSHPYNEAQTLGRADVMSKVYQQHPNLSVFHSNDSTDVPFPTPSPPPSPSKTQSGIRNMFKRNPQHQQHPFQGDNEGEHARPASPFKLPLLPKKGAAQKAQTLAIKTNLSQVSLDKPSAESPRPQSSLRRSFDNLRQFTQPRPDTNTTSNGANPRPTRPSVDSTSSADVRNPGTPVSAVSEHVLDHKGSLRSILKDRNTPGTGRSVRFFSRDAYKVISPDVTASEAEQSSKEAVVAEEENAFINKLQAAASFKNRSPPRASVLDVFSPSSSPSAQDTLKFNVPATSTAPPTPYADNHASRSQFKPDATGMSMGLMPPPDVSNIFDLSMREQLPPIPISSEGLMDGAIEIHEDNDGPAVRVGNASLDSGRSYVDASLDSNASNMSFDSNVEMGIAKGNLTNEGGYFDVPPPLPAKHSRSASFGSLLGQTVFHSPSGSVSSGPHSAPLSNNPSPLSSSGVLSANPTTSPTNAVQQSPGIGVFKDGRFIAHHKRVSEVSTASAGKFSVSSSSSGSGYGQVIPSKYDIRASPASGKSSLQRGDSAGSYRNRAFSDTVFHSMLRGGGGDSTPSPNAKRSSRQVLPGGFESRVLMGYEVDPSRAGLGDVEEEGSRPVSFLPGNGTPEADINDLSSDALAQGVFASRAQSPQEGEGGEPDPFSTHATAYYTPATPPEKKAKAVARAVRGGTASAEEDLIVSLRTQLALREEMCKQFEIDLGARDELVNGLAGKCERVEAEVEKRRAQLRAWKKRVGELERACRGLEEQVDRSRQESFERSVMDEASGEAMRELHRRMGRMEAERREWEGREQSVLRELHEARSRGEEAENELKTLRAELKRREEGEEELRRGIREAKEQMEMMEQLAAGEGDNSMVVREHERAALELLQAEKRDTSQSLDSARGQIEELEERLAKRDQEYDVLKAELEAQWKGTEEASERMDRVTRERDAARAELEECQRRMEGMEVEWQTSENRKMELEAEVQDVLAAKEDLEHEREQLEEEIRQERAHADQLESAVQERDARISELEQERKYALDKATRTEELVKERDAEIENLAHRVVSCEDEAENLREQLSTVKREHGRLADEHRRTLEEGDKRSDERVSQVENLLKEKAEAEVQLRALEERVKALDDEANKLRRQVHELKMEGSDKDLKMVHMKKQLAAMEEDNEGLNVALDSKQQELELVKRKLAVRAATAGTPTLSKTTRRESVLATPASRRSSVVAADTPSSSRPSSAMSEANTTAKALSKTSRPNHMATDSVGSVGSSGSSTATKAKIAGAMGPPSSIVIKPRSSVSGTTATPASRVRSPVSVSTTASRLSGARSPPSALPRSLTASMSRRVSVDASTRTPIKNRGAPNQSESEQSGSGKENNPKAARRMSAIPVPA